jgi:hypothetical protein
MTTNRKRRTPTTVAVIPLDVKRICAEALPAVQKQVPEAVGASLHYDLAVIDTQRGLFIVDRDGVGPIHGVTDAQPFEINVYPEYPKTESEDGSTQGRMALFPVVSATLGPDVLRRYIDADAEPVNLADWIRTFGHRLESNYTIWREALEAAQPVTVTTLES